MPFGPAGIVSIRRTLRKGLISGLVSCLGIVLADSIFATIAGLGLLTVTTFLELYEILIHIVGGVIVVLLGLYAYFDRRHETGPISSTTLLRDFSSSILITLANPLMILVFMALFSFLQLEAFHQNILRALLVLAGLASGACCMWGVLNWTAYIVKRRLQKDVINIIHRVSGIILVVIGTFFIIKGFLGIFS